MDISIDQVSENELTELQEPIKFNLSYKTKPLLSQMDFTRVNMIIMTCGHLACSLACSYMEMIVYNSINSVSEISFFL